MAITFVGSKTFAHNATSVQSCSLTDLLDTSGSPATLLNDDIVVINYGQGNNSNRTNAAMTPSGYTEVTATDLYRDDTNDANQLVSYKFMGATPDTTVGIPASSGTTHGVSVVIHAFRGVDTTTPLDVAPTTAGATNGARPNAPSITPTTTGAWILACGVSGCPATINLTNPTGMSTTTNHFRSALSPNVTIDSSTGTALYTSWASGAYDPATFGGGTTDLAGAWTAVTVALRPAPPAAFESFRRRYSQQATGVIG